MIDEKYNSLFSFIDIELLYKKNSCCTHVCAYYKLSHRKMLNHAQGVAKIKYFAMKDI